MRQESPQQTLKATISQITRDHAPETVEQLTRLVKERFPSFSDTEILDAILNLQDEEKIRFTQTQSLPRNFTNYLKTGNALWYWITVALTLAAVISVFSLPENAYPIIVIRYVVGTVFILWLPGYAFIKALFPTKLPIKTSDKNLDTVERIALSIGTNLALVPIVGLFLNYTPWGIRLAPVTLGLTALTLIFATAAVVRENQLRSKELDSPTESNSP